MMRIVAITLLTACLLTAGCSQYADMPPIQSKEIVMTQSDSFAGIPVLETFIDRKDESKHTQWSITFVVHAKDVQLLEREFDFSLTPHQPIITKEAALDHLLSPEMQLRLMEYIGKNSAYSYSESYAICAADTVCVADKFEGPTLNARTLSEVLMST